ncbi:MAG TPA: biotin--[acetyl-CoA-carboxylase] ligase, partial [Acidimicrobiales bacterium]|nr:biotin--[acetyl-CoA-carboxylase] ligase [Acidimicrobiales bacterium]
MRGDLARSELRGTRFEHVRWVSETGSTNHDLLDQARLGAPDGTVLVADHQTAGRGRLDRSWVAPPDASLLVSVLLRPRLEPPDAPLLTVAMALAVAGTAAGRDAGARVKWPNDVVVDGEPPRKLAGVLAESLVAAGSGLAVVVGVGVNVDWPTPLPPELAALSETATALNLETGTAV